MSPAVEVKNPAAAIREIEINAEDGEWKRLERKHSEAFPGEAHLSVTVFKKGDKIAVGGIITREQEGLEKGEGHIAFASEEELFEGVEDF